MPAKLYRCLKFNWLSGMYMWVTFAAADETDARRQIAVDSGYLPDSLSATSEQYAV